MTPEVPWSDVALLSDSHDGLAFATGLESVDDWFCTKALPEQNAGRVRTHLCMAFFALKHVVVNLEGASRRMRGTAETGSGDATTGLLLAQMGVRSDLQGAGVGKSLIRHVMGVAADLHERSAFRLLVVDAENPSLVPYYERYGFTPLANDLRLIMKMSAVRKIVAATS